MRTEKVKTEEQKSSGLPLIIIGAVLALAAIGAYFYFNSAKQAPVKNANSASNKTADRMANAPLGANPPNILGSTTAPVTVEEFADFQCAACASVHPALKEITGFYGTKIRFIFRNLPLAIPAHDKSYEAATALEAVGMQDKTKFWQMQSKLFENQQAWTANPNYRAIWEGYVRDLGLDVEKYKADMAGRDAKARVDADMQRGRALNIDSTPTLFVNGKNIPLNSISAAGLRQIIDSELQTASKAPAANSAAPGSAPADNSAPAASPAAPSPAPPINK